MEETKNMIKSYNVLANIRIKIQGKWTVKGIHQRIAQLSIML